MIVKKYSFVEWLVALLKSFALLCLGFLSLVCLLLVEAARAVRRKVCS